MSTDQTDHLRAYGVAYASLEVGLEVEWLLNFQGGSFLLEDNENLVNLCLRRGVSFRIISIEEEAQIKALALLS